MPCKRVKHPITMHLGPYSIAICKDMPELPWGECHGAFFGDSNSLEPATASAIISETATAVLVTR